MLANSLEKQIHRDYELIVVDDLKGRDCRKYLEEHDILVKYYGPSKPKCYPDTPFGGCNAVNTGLLKVSKQCDVTILVEDYAWLFPDALSKWSSRLEANNKSILMTGVGVEWKYKPPQHLGHITVWDEEFTGDFSKCTFKGLWVPGVYHKLCSWGGIWDWHYCAVPMHVWETINGLDERFDYYRLYPTMYFPTQVGIHNFSFFTDVDNAVFMIDHREWSLYDKSLWSIGGTDESKGYKRIQAIYSVSPNCFNLMERERHGN